MGTHTIHRSGVPTSRTTNDEGRLLFTTIGGAALVVSAFLNWTRGMTGITLSNHALTNTTFLAQSDVVRTVGGIAVVLGLAGMFGLVDRSGWLTRLFGLLGIALFVMFVIEVMRSSDHTMQVGSWLALAGGIVMLIGGFMRGAQVVTEPVIVEERHVEPAQPVDPRTERMEREDPRLSTEQVDPRGFDTDPAAESEQRGRA